MAIDDGIYIVRPKGFDKGGFLIGPVPRIFPPPDVPVRVGEKLIDHWKVSDGENDAANVFAGSGNPNDYKWVVRRNTLFVSSVSPPDQFRFEDAGQGFSKIGIPNEDLVLTFNSDAFPQLLFKNANGFDNELFKVIRIDRD